MRYASGILTLLLCSSAFSAQDRRQLTVEWIFSDEGEEVTALPTAYWASGSELILLDTRRPKADRTLERVQPDSDARSPAVDAKAALSSLRVSRARSSWATSWRRCAG